MVAFISSLPLTSEYNRQGNQGRSALQQKRSIGAATYKRYARPPVIRSSLADELTRAPRSVREARVVVVGGGPVGTVAASMLWFRGVKEVTLIEKIADFDSLNPSQSYALGVFPRGFKALEAVPGLNEVIGNNGAQVQNLIRVTEKGKTKTFPLPPPLTSVQYYLRDSLLKCLKSFLLTRTSVCTRYGSELIAVRYSSSGIELEIETDGKVEKLFSRLVIAADGQDSIVVSSLRQADRSLVTSKQGLGTDEKTSASVGLKVKSIVLGLDELKKAGVDEEDISRSMVSLNSVMPNKPVRERVKLRTFPTPRHVIDSFGGLLGVMVNPEDSMLWSVETSDEFYDLLQRNFPAVDMRKLIARDHVENFLRTEPATFPVVTRVNSLTANVGGESGVVVLGDAAHSFPPDSGLGVNSGFEDVSKLAVSLDKLEDGATIQEVMADYERQNDDETTALVYIARVAAPFQYGNAPLRRKIHSAYGIVRSLLAQQFPFLFELPLNMQALGLRPYSQMVQRDRQSAQMVFVLAIAAIIASGFYLYDQIQTYVL